VRENAKERFLNMKAKGKCPQNPRINWKKQVRRYFRGKEDGGNRQSSSYWKKQVNGQAWLLDNPLKVEMF
jgi:hypothetical protein